MKPFQNYNGGKNGAGVYQTLINHVPRCDTMIIPFLGNCGLLANLKKLPDSIIGIDKNKEVVLAWSKITIGSVDVLNQCGIDYLEKLLNSDLITTADNDKKVFIYCDPPYLIETRTCKTKLYKYEMNTSDHVRLLKILNKLALFKNVFIMLSSYPNDLYTQNLNLDLQWNLKSYQTIDRRGKKRTELLYMNYAAENFKLQDYSYIGNNFIQRQIIKRKLSRTLNKIRNLDQRERELLLLMIDDSYK